MSALDAMLRNTGSDPRAQKEAMRDVLRRATLVAVGQNMLTAVFPLLPDGVCFTTVDIIGGVSCSFATRGRSGMRERVLYLSLDVDQTALRDLVLCSQR